MKIFINVHFKITVPLSNSIFSPFYRQMESKMLPYQSERERQSEKGCGKTLREIYKGQEPALRKWW